MSLEGLGLGLYTGNVREILSQGFGLRAYDLGLITMLMRLVNKQSEICLP